MTYRVDMPDDLAEVIERNPQVNWLRLFEQAIKGWQKEQENVKVGLRMEYFVLQPRGATNHATASRAAMRAYAFAIRGYNPVLASELCEWADREMNEWSKGDAKGGSVKRGSGDSGDGAPPDDGESAAP